jgi:hypothetical protein
VLQQRVEACPPGSRRRGGRSVVCSAAWQGALGGSVAPAGWFVNVLALHGLGVQVSDGLPVVQAASTSVALSPRLLNSAVNPSVKGLKGLAV